MGEPLSMQVITSINELTSWQVLIKIGWIIPKYANKVRIETFHE